MTYNEWAARHPAAALDFQAMLNALPWPRADEETDGRSEAWAQQQVRMQIARAGAMAWRNNEGATPSKCPDCGVKRQPIRYGLGNDSARLNDAVKFGDLIGAVPRLIRPEHIGQTIAQFAMVECKKPGWVFKGTPEEIGQAKGLALVKQLGGFATFSTGQIAL